jgi:hypothetical protein
MYAENKQSAEEAFEAAMRGRGAAYPGEDHREYAAKKGAEIRLAADLGRFSHPTPEYNLNAAARDRLIAHARHDARYALLNTIHLISDVQVLTRLVKTMAAILIAFFVVFLLLTFRPPSTWWSSRLP